MNKADLIASATIGLDPKHEAARTMSDSIAQIRKNSVSPTRLSGAAAFTEEIPVGRPEAGVMEAALVERMKTEENSNSLTALGEALGSLSAKLEANDLQPGGNIIMARIEPELSPETMAGLASVWVALATVAHRDQSTGDRVQECINLLQNPFIVGGARKSILQDAGRIVRKDFHNDLREFVDWAVSGEGRKLDLLVRPRPYVWSKLSE